MPTYKVFIGGLAKAGKTETIKGVSILPLVSVEKKLKGTDVEIQMDYGRVHIENCMIYLYGPHLSSELERGWQKLKHEMDALVFLFSGVAPETVPQSLLLLKSSIYDWDRPVVVGVNGIDREGFHKEIVAEIISAIGPSIPVIPYNSLHRESVAGIVLTLVRLLKQHN